MSTPTAEQILRKHLVGEFNTEGEYDDYISRVDPEVFKAMEEYTSSIGGMNWVRPFDRLPKFDPEAEQKPIPVKYKDGQILGIYFNGQDSVKRWMAMVDYWLDESPTPILQNQHDDDLAIEALDFYYRHISWKLGSSDLGDIERKNYEGLAQKLKIRIQ